MLRGSPVARARRWQRLCMEMASPEYSAADQDHMRISAGTANVKELR